MKANERVGWIQIAMCYAYMNLTWIDFCLFANLCQKLNVVSFDNMWGIWFWNTYLRWFVPSCMAQSLSKLWRQGIRLLKEQYWRRMMFELLGHLWKDICIWTRDYIPHFLYIHFFYRPWKDEDVLGEDLAIKSCKFVLVSSTVCISWSL